MAREKEDLRGQAWKDDHQSASGDAVIGNEIFYMTTTVTGRDAVPVDVFLRPALKETREKGYARYIPIFGITDEDRKDRPKIPPNAIGSGSVSIDGKEYYVDAYRPADGASPNAPAVSLVFKEKVQMATHVSDDVATDAAVVAAASNEAPF